ncbi:MAG TPA: hypothetical protein VFI80_10970, partial [Burkholderiales bacterium]|nr:hypothetical protein [Burkholderiales bacterium]
MLGFGAGFIAPLLFGAVLDLAGGKTAALAWGFAFTTLGAGAVVMAGLIRSRARAGAVVES